MLKIIKDIAVAMINATLILILLCLFMAWRVSSTANDLAASFASNIEVLKPVRGSVEDMTAELAALRDDLQTLRTQGGTLNAAVTQRIDTRLDALQTQLVGVSGTLEPYLQDPAILIDKGFQSAANHAVSAFADMRGCVPPSQSAELALPATTNG
jgi:hypothetical protein